MKLLLKIIFSALVTATAFSCNNKPQWHVDGRIEGAEGQTMYVEASTDGRWYALDSVQLNSSGEFAFESDASGYPDIYRLRLGDKTLYFPIDSIETVTVISKASAFDHDYTLSGTEAAEMLMAVDRKVLTTMDQKGAKATPSDSLLKRELSNMLLGDPSGIVSYYIINKKIGGVPLFNPSDKNDLRIIGAVANAFNAHRPTDPRTNYLKHLFLDNKKFGGVADTIVANEAALIDVDLFDRKGNKRSLAQTARDNKVVVLCFTNYGGEFSPALNIELNKLYTRHHGQGLEVYQIGFDNDEIHWRETASNLPWVTVYNSPTDGPVALANYNVGSLPTLFIIANGELRDRVTNPSQLESAVAKYL